MHEVFILRNFQTSLTNFLKPSNHNQNCPKMFGQLLSTSKAISMATFYIVACCDKDERLFLNIFISEIFNLIFVINNVLKNTLPELLSLA